MADAHDVIRQAEALGDALATHPAVRAFVDAQLVVARDPEAQRILEEYRRTADEIRQRETAGQPIEPDQKRRLMNCERALAGHDPLKTWMRAQTDYMHLMNMINQAMEGPVAKAMQAAAGAKSA